MTAPNDTRPEDCPEPGWHETHRYCPCCTWTDGTPTGTATPMRLHVAEDWPTNSGALLRRVGWLDQKGRVWIALPDPGTFDGGSLTPLLIDAAD